MQLESADTVGVTSPEPVPAVPAGSIAARCRSLLTHPAFELTIVAVIVANAIVLGMGIRDREQHETDDLLTRLRAAREALEDAERELQKTPPVAS